MKVFIVAAVAIFAVASEFEFLVQLFEKKFVVIDSSYNIRKSL